MRDEPAAKALLDCGFACVGYDQLCGRDDPTVEGLNTTAPVLVVYFGVRQRGLDLHPHRYVVHVAIAHWSTPPRAVSFFRAGESTILVEHDADALLDDQFSDRVSYWAERNEAAG